MSDHGTADVKTARTSFAVIEAVAAVNGAGVSELARYLDRSKGGIYKHAHTLTDLGYLRKEGDTYHLGVAFWKLGTTVRDRLLPDRIKSVIDDLAASIGHVVTLVIYENGRGTVLYCQAPPATKVKPFEEGEDVPLHATAAGKAILAYLPEPERKTALRDDLEEFTEATLTDVESIEEHLEAVRERRLARDHGEYDPGVECVAAPIVDASGHPHGSITVNSGSHGVAEGELEADESLIVSASKSIENTMND